MLARFRPRLTYANVVATLALFIALGGSSYAALNLTGKDIRNRSLTRVDIRKNTLTGTEINESRLRTVPRAARAANANSADIAKTADSATQAVNATNASLAAVATDAQKLAGQGANAFEKSSRVQFGAASVGPSGPSGEQVILSWPEMGVEVLSSSGSCGDPSDLPLAIRNTKSSGPSVVILNLKDASGGTTESETATAGATARVCALNNEYEGELTDSTGRTLFVDCFAAQGQIRCVGIRSEA